MYVCDAGVCNIDVSLQWLVVSGAMVGLLFGWMMPPLSSRRADKQGTVLYLAELPAGGLA